MQISYESMGTSTFLVYALQEDDVIDNMSMGMVANNNIKGVLPLNFTQINEQRFIKYNISSKVTLSQFFSGVVNKYRLIRVMRGLVSAVMEAEEYMLEVSAFLWDKEYIYVDVETADASLVCVPLVQTGENRVRLEIFFRQLLLDIQYDQSENCNYVTKLLTYFNANSNFSLHDFNKLLISIENEKSGPASAGAGASLGSGVKSDNKHAGSYAGASGSAGKSTGAGQGAQNISRPESSNIPGDAKKPGEMNIPGGVKIPGGGYVPEKPAAASEKKEKKGFSLFGNKAKEKPEKQEKDKKKDDKKQKDPKGGMAVPGMNIPGMNIPGAGNAAAPVQNVPPAPKPMETYSEDSDKTEILLDETEVWDDGIATQAAWLELLEAACAGVPERVDLNFSKPFITLGRLSSDEIQPDVTFPRELKKIGRQHARIERSGNEYFLIDMGSANHTLLDNEVLTPNQTYQLQDGMEIVFTTFQLIRYRVHLTS